MGPKKSRKNVRRVEVPTDTYREHTEEEGGVKRERKGGGREITEGGEGEGGSQAEWKLHRKKLPRWRREWPKKTKN